jgi:protease-4
MDTAQKTRGWVWFMAGIGMAFSLVIIAAIALAVAFRGSQRPDVVTGRGGKIGVIDVDGVILTAKSVVDPLRRYADDASIRAIILHINSPGGGAAASQEIFQETKKVRDEKKKPIVASVETVGASGAYYIAAGTGKVYAEPASIVGSIGVIAEWVNYEDLLRWAKLKPITMKAGELKDAGSPTRDMTPEEKAYMQGLIDNMHDQFIRDVAAGRSVPEDQIRQIASGRVWTGEQALPLKLVDRLGSFQDALEETAKMVGINGEPALVRPQNAGRNLMDLVFGDTANLIPDPGKALETNIGFYYLWK